MGRSRFPPAAMMWPASCGMNATGLCMRSRMSVLTRSRSRSSKATSRSSDGAPRLWGSDPRTLTIRATADPARDNSGAVFLTPPPLRASIEREPRRSSPGHSPAMKELLRTNDPVRLSFVEALLSAAGIESVGLAQHTSAIEGTISAIQRRITLDYRDHGPARLLLSEAGEAT